jgi:hypothetical protein
MNSASRIERIAFHCGGTANERAIMVAPLAEVLRAAAAAWNRCSGDKYADGDDRATVRPEAAS